MYRSVWRRRWMNTTCRDSNAVVCARWKHTETVPLERICIVGSGPAGFYTAKYMMKEHPSVQVDMIEALPTPFGLVRSGVAPDHPEVKSVMNDFERVAEQNRFSFLGNVPVGNGSSSRREAALSLTELKEYYNAIVLAYGAADDRKLHIPGEHLRGVLSARRFVNWYNGHPHFVDDAIHSPALDCDTAVVIGQGNVAIDCARILSKTPDELKHTDMCQHALDVLAQSTVKKVIVVGRRGAAQAAFTMKEIREVTKLKNAQCVVDPKELTASDTVSSREEIRQHRAAKRMTELLSKTAQEFEAARQAERQLHIRFLLSPVAFIPDVNDPSRVGAIKVERTELHGDAFHQRPVGTGEFEHIPCGLVLKSIGYKSVPIDGAPFDTDRSLIPNQQGRVTLTDGDRQVVQGLYCAGWLKRGPSGIIGTNITDARETVARVLEDAQRHNLRPIQKSGGLEAIRQMIESRSGRTCISWDQYLRIASKERASGEKVGKPREKFVSLDALIQAGSSDG